MRTILVSPVLVNPGSGPVQSGEGWTNTRERAWQEAQRWHARMLADGLVDIVLLPEVEEREGRWCYTFVHRVTETRVVLETHGIDDVEAYEKANVFAPRVYWNGSSCSAPCLDDWKAEGFAPVQTYRRRRGGS